ncbi:MAG: hypothetical protein AABX30_00625 [Nanoarchaeota archaeon]
MDKKRAKEFLKSSLMLILLIFSLSLIFAAVRVTTTTGTDSFNVTKQNVYVLFNISFNASIFNEQNVSQINITLPSSFTLNNSYTNASFTNNYSVSSNVIKYINHTGDYFNATNISIWFNASAATAGNFNITIYFNATNSTTMNIYINDTVTPTSISTTSVLAGGNYSASSIVLNVTIAEDLPSYVMFNITNWSGQQNITYRASQQGTGTSWNATLVTTSLPEGNYSLIVWVNDTVMSNWNDQSLLNNSFYVRNFTIDRTSPSVTLTASTSTTSSVSATIALSDTMTGVAGAGTCSSSRGGASITGTGASQTLTETGLSCGATYSHIVTCGDVAGNQGTKTIALVTSDCGSSSSSGTSTGDSTVSWTSTIIADSAELSSTGIAQKLSSKSRVKLKVGGVAHYVGVTALTTTSATIQISSNPVDIKLNVGQDAKLNLNTDNTYDIYVKLIGIESNKANLDIKKISEVIPAGQGPVFTTGQQITSETGTGDETEGTGDETEGTSPWIWVIIIVLVVIAIGAGIAVKKKRE